MTRTDAVWAAVIGAEDEHGEAAEAFARGEAAQATEAGDAELAAHWAQVAGELHTLHTINREWARPGQRPTSKVSATSPAASRVPGAATRALGASSR